ncbi:unnamed protein product, partial [Symbiodinium sp. CCMP2456]
ECRALGRSHGCDHQFILPRSYEELTEAILQRQNPGTSSFFESPTPCKGRLGAEILREARELI